MHPRLGDLDGQVADPAGAAMDQDSLPALDLPDVDDAVQCGEADERQRCGVHVIERAGLRASCRDGTATNSA